MRAVDEKADVDAGVLVAHCVMGVRKIEAVALTGRKADLKDERLILWVTAAQLQGRWRVVMLRFASRNVRAKPSWR